MLDEGVGLCVIPKLDPILVHVDEGPSELLELGVGTNPGHQKARGHDRGLETPGLVLGWTLKNTPTYNFFHTCSLKQSLISLSF